MQCGEDLLPVLKEDLCGAIAIARIIPVDKGFDLAFGAEDLVDLVPQFAAAYAMDDDHGREVMGQGEVEIFFEGLQLEGKDFEIVQGARFVGEFFRMQVQLRSGRLQVVSGA